MAVIRKRGNRYQADIKLTDGRRLRKAFATKSEAEAFLRSHDPVTGDKVPSTFEAFINDQFERLWGDNKRPEATKINLRVLYRYIPKDTPVANITTPLIERVIGKMKDDRASNATINRKLATLSKALKHALRLELIDRTPVIEYLKESKGRDRELTDEEERAAVLFFEHMGLVKSGALFDFLLYTGCRTGEAFNLDRKDVTPAQFTFRDTKNGTDRIIPAVKRSRAAWQKIAGLTNAEKPFGDLGKETFRNHWNLLREHLDYMNQKDFVPHMLRHTCCTRLVRGGIDLPKVMLWMGHRNIQTTMRYAHMAPKDLDGAVKVLGG